MKVYAVLKNDSILNGKPFALPEQAVDFFADEFLIEYPNAKVEDIKDDLLQDLIKDSYFSVQAGNDEWECKTYKSGEI